ncbi:MAG: hypothetical protein LUG21_03185 [Clostridiales bacterium]|nr:hypothetical protein [Clostridiales bacterium]
MKNRNIIFMLIIFAEVFILIISAALGKMTVFWILLFIIAAESIYIAVKLIRNYDWQCQKCKTVFSVSAKDVLFGINGGDVKNFTALFALIKNGANPLKKIKPKILPQG